MNFQRKHPAAFAALTAPTVAAAVPAHTAADEGATAKRAFPLPLPSWADCDEGRELLAAIVIERPAKRNFDNGCSKWGGWEYAGRTANKLRDLYRRHLADICDRERAAYEAGEQYGAITAELNAAMLAEQPDALIKRVLDQPTVMKVAA